MRVALASVVEASSIATAKAAFRKNVMRGVGVITAARVEGEDVVVEVELDGRASVREHDADFASGKLPFVSAGYQPLTEREPREDPDGGPPIVEVTSWRLLEVSSVLVPADPTVGIRSKDMTTPAAKPEAHDEERISVGGVRSILAALGIAGSGKRAKREDDMGDDESRKRGKREDGDEDEDEDEETVDERAARLKVRKAKRDAEEDDKRAKREADGTDDSKVSEDERKKRSKARTMLRGVAKRYCRAAEFDVLVKTGASIAELRTAVAGGMATPVSPESRSATTLATARRSWCRSASPSLLSAPPRTWVAGKSRREVPSSAPACRRRSASAEGPFPGLVFDHVVGLGGNCETAHQLRRHGRLRRSLDADGAQRRLLLSSARRGTISGSSSTSPSPIPSRRTS